MTTLYRADDADLLVSVLAGEQVHLDAAAILDGLTAEQAEAKPNGLPYSIAELVSHLCYWQEWFNGCLVDGFTGIAQHSVDGWPAVPAGGWDVLRDRYLQSHTRGLKPARYVGLPLPGSAQRSPSIVP